MVTSIETAISERATEEMISNYNREINTVVDSDSGILNSFVTTPSDVMLGSFFGKKQTTTTPSRFMAYNRCVFDCKDAITTGNDVPIFADLGCGLGLVSIFAAHHGWKSYGIDINPECVHYAKENAQSGIKAGFIAKGSVNFAKGDIFPSDFDYSGNPHNFFNEYLTELRNQQSTNPYELLEIKPSDVDLFYHYQIETIDNLLRFFSQYTKKGAVFLFSGSFTEKPYELPSDVQLAYRDERWMLDFFQKV